LSSVRIAQPDEFDPGIRVTIDQISVYGCA
jgi:hypothetical protein